MKDLQDVYDELNRLFAGHKNRRKMNDILDEYRNGLKKQKTDLEIQGKEVSSTYLNNRYFLVCFVSVSGSHHRYVMTTNGDYFCFKEFESSFKLGKIVLTNIIELTKTDFDKLMLGEV